MYNYNAVITNIVDGDTFDADIDLGFHIHIHERIRVLGVDTPENRGEEAHLGRICTEYARRNFLGRNVIVSTKRTDSFGRWLADVVFEEDYMDMCGILTSLGVNKFESNYSEDNVSRLAAQLGICQ